jgi:hypothetical protein
MGKITLFLFILIISGCSSRKPVLKSQWINFDYNRAIAYYSKNELFDQEFVVNGKLNPQISDTIGVTLSDKRIQELNYVLSSPDKYVGYPVMDCFLPRHGVVFWDKENRPVAWVSVCFECGILKTNPAVDKEELVGLEPFFKRIGFPIKEKLN